MKAKKSSFLVLQENQIFSEKFLYHLLPNMMIHAHEKFTPSDFVKKQIIGKCMFFLHSRTSPLTGFNKSFHG